jgi:uncharacterized lipoprotein YajG
MRVLAVVALFALAGCNVAPAVTAAGPQSVTLRQDPAWQSDATIAEHAERACQQYGKTAQYRFRAVEGIGFPGGPVSHTYDCI